jgi:hypothetical protein
LRFWNPGLVPSHSEAVLERQNPRKRDEIGTSSRSLLPITLRLLDFDRDFNDS